MTRPLRQVADESLSWRFSRAGGPGGQHVNTSSTRVELDCDLARAGLPEDVTERLVAKLGPVVRVVAADTRSQQRNRELALERLQAQLEAAAHVPRTRRATRPTRASVERRLADKKRRSSRTAERRRRGDDG